MKPQPTKLFSVQKDNILFNKIFKKCMSCSKYMYRNETDINYLLKFKTTNDSAS